MPRQDPESRSQLGLELQRRLATNPAHDVKRKRHIQKNRVTPSNREIMHHDGPGNFNPRGAHQLPVTIGDAVANDRFKRIVTEEEHLAGGRIDLRMRRELVP